MDKIILVSRDMLPENMSFLGEAVVNELHTGKAIMISAYGKDDEVTGISVFRLNYETTKAELFYFRYFLDNIDKRNNFYLEAERILKEIGVTELTKILIGPKEEIKDEVKFLYCAGFDPVIYNWHIVGIKKKDILSKKVLEPYLTLDKDRFKYKKGVINSIASKNPDSNLSKLISVCSIKNSRFYIKNNKIMAAALVSPVKDDKLDIFKLYLNKEVKETAIILQLLVQAIRFADESIKEVNIAITSDGMKNIISYVFPEEDSFTYYQRYDKYLM